MHECDEGRIVHLPAQVLSEKQKRQTLNTINLRNSTNSVVHESCSANEIPIPWEILLFQHLSLYGNKKLQCLESSCGTSILTIFFKIWNNDYITFQ